MAEAATFALELALGTTNTTSVRRVPFALLATGNWRIIIPATFITVTVKTLALDLLSFPLLAAKIAKSAACCRTLPAMTTGKVTGDSSTGSIFQAATGLSLRCLRDSTQTEQRNYCDENLLPHRGNSHDPTKRLNQESGSGQTPSAIGPLPTRQRNCFG